jgi:hypothetical protein
MRYKKCGLHIESKTNISWANLMVEAVSMLTLLTIRINILKKYKSNTTHLAPLCIKPVILDVTLY